MSGGMTARKLRIILAVFMVLIVALTVAGFMFVQRSLNDYAVTISRLNADAASGEQNLQTLNGLQAKLDERQAAISSAQSLVATEATYADRSINDISRIARESGVTITSFEFVGSGASGTASAPPSATSSAAAPTAMPGTAAAPTASTGSPAGVTKKTISVSIQSPLEYSNLMKFLIGIETNDLEMQIPSVAMTKAEGSKVTTQQFSIEVYVRQ